MEDYDQDAVNSIIAELVDFGVLVPNGMLGEEFTYSVNIDLAQKYFPDFYELLLEDINDTLLSLVEKDLVSVDYDENLEPRFAITEKGQQVLDMENPFDFLDDES